MNLEYQQYLKDNIIVDDDCWIWQGALMGKGYGQAKRLNGDQSAHRNSYKVFKGEIPEGKIVRHTCDVMYCINPDHLITGTYENNMADCIARGRYVGNKGTTFMRTITDEEIRGIRKMAADDYSYRQIADYYGVSKGYAWKVVQNQFRKIA